MKQKAQKARQQQQQRHHACHRQACIPQEEETDSKGITKPLSCC
jgi:hypothetical protein